MISLRACPSHRHSRCKAPHWREHLRRWARWLPLAALAAMVALTPAARAGTLGLAYAAHDPEFDDAPLALQGLTLTYDWQTSGPLYLKAEILRDGDKSADYYGVGIGILKNFVSGREFDWGVDGGLMYGKMDLPFYRNTNTLITLGTHTYLIYRLSDQLGLDARIGYQYHFDLTKDTQCQDGSSTDDRGAAACRRGGGIAYYANQLGDGGGLHSSIGVTYLFK